MQILSDFLGKILKFIFEALQGIGAEPASVSYYALSIILMSVLMKLVTMPLMLKSSKNAEKMQSLGPKQKEIQEKYKKDPETLNRELMKLYKEENISPTGGCLPMILNLIIVFAMLSVIRDPAKHMFENKELINTIAKNFFWIKDITGPDPLKFGLPLLYSLSMFLYSSILSSQTPKAPNQNMQSMNMMTKYMLPVMMFFFSWTWPAGLLLYWGTGNVVEILVRFISKSFIKQGEEK